MGRLLTYIIVASWWILLALRSPTKSVLYRRLFVRFLDKPWALFIYLQLLFKFTSSLLSHFMVDVSAFLGAAHGERGLDSCSLM